MGHRITRLRLPRQKGLIVFDDNTGEAIRVSGPHEVYNEGLVALCEAIG